MPKVIQDDGLKFTYDYPEVKKGGAKTLVLLKPFGVSLVPDPNRPVLLLKDETGHYTLPVPINPLEAGVTLTQFSRSSAPVTPHRVLEEMLNSLDIKIERCVFVEIKGHFQFVRLFFKNHPTLKSIKMRAEEAMSVCLHLNVKIYASTELMMASRELQMRTASTMNEMPERKGPSGLGYIQ